jgi:hypothetical protein
MYNRPKWLNGTLGCDFTELAYMDILHYFVLKKIFYFFINWFAFDDKY